MFSAPRKASPKTFGHPVVERPFGGSSDGIAYADFRLLQVAQSLVTDSELLEMALLGVVPKQNVRVVVQALLRGFGTFAAAVAASFAELREIEGLGEAGAAALSTIPIAAKRLALLEDVDRPHVGSIQALHRYIHPRLARQEREHFLIMYLNTKNRLIADEIRSDFRLFDDPIDLRQFLKTLLSHYATAMIVVRHTPTRDPDPSPFDYELIKMLKSAVAPLSVALQEYLLVGKTRSISFHQARVL